MKSICFFSSYYTLPHIPYYIKYYIEELQKHFSEIIFFTNEKAFSNEDEKYLTESSIRYRLYKNEGYDFGMWYKAFKEFDVSKYDRVGLVNDSCILFKTLDDTFDWINTNNLDYCGLVDSDSVSYHIQSYFVIINKNAIDPVVKYFMKTGIVNGYLEVIRAYEIGLSKHLLRSGIAIGALYNKRHNETAINPSFVIISDLINDGIPMIKKKIIFRTYRLSDYLTWLRTNFNIDSGYYIQKIKDANKNVELIDFDKVICDVGFSKSDIDIHLFNTVLRVYRIASKIKPLRYLFHRLIDLKRYLKIET